MILVHDKGENDNEIDNELEDIDDTNVRKNLLLNWWCKYHTLSDVNTYSYEEIEVRWN